MGILISEHKSKSIFFGEEGSNTESNVYITDKFVFEKFQKIEPQEFNSSNFKYYSVAKDDDGIKLTAGYCVGIDWLGDTNRFIYVEPKINIPAIDCFETLKEEDNKAENEKDENQPNQSNELITQELDFLKMLLTVYSGSIDGKYLQNLICIDWNAKQISIKQDQDHLTPFLVVQFLQMLMRITIKGLKKTYYKVDENLNSRVKGKILVSQQVKQNVLKGRFTKTLCQYQVFGEDNVENRFLKIVLKFAIQYVQNNKAIFQQNITSVRHLIDYCRPSFENIGNNIENYELKQIKPHSFFKEYSEAIKIGQYILKRFSYNMSKTVDKEIKTPPFWIDMPRLFELYVYHHLLKSNNDDKDKIRYQFATYGNSLDFLIKDENNPMIIDTKYKLHYENGHLHQDIRQVSGYARLKRVRKELGIKEKDDRNIDCLIIFPSSTGIDLEREKLGIEDLISKKKDIEPYYKVYKLGVQLPLIEGSK